MMIQNRIGLLNCGAASPIMMEQMEATSAVNARLVQARDIVLTPFENSPSSMICIATNPALASANPSPVLSLADVLAIPAITATPEMASTTPAQIFPPTLRLNSAQ